MRGTLDLFLGKNISAVNSLVHTVTHPTLSLAPEEVSGEH